LITFIKEETKPKQIKVKAKGVIEGKK